MCVHQSGLLPALPDGTVDAVKRLEELLGQERARADELQRRLEERANQLSVALEKIDHLSRTDALTGVLNRLAFAEHAAEALKRAERYKRTVALLLCDLDHFRHVNEVHGQQVGDVLIRHVASRLMRSLRCSDKVARTGGGEFAILLTETSTDKVLEVAQRCRQCVARLPIKDCVPGSDEPLTVSVGVAKYPDHGATIDQLRSRAEKALRKAKEGGRNRVVTFETRFERRAASGVSQQVQPTTSVLIIDADKARAEGYRQLLSDRYDVTLAQVGTKALSYCARQPFDVIVADEDVGTENGVDFLRKSIAFLPNALRLLVLESEDAYLTIRGTNSGRVDRFLLREDTRAHLRNAIEHGLLSSQLRGTRLPSPVDLAPLVGGAQTEALESILQSGRLNFAFQPILATDGQQIAAHEALCRPRHPAFPGPEEFFETALQLGALWDLGRLARRNIIQHIEQLPPDSLLFINLHPAEISDHQLLEGESFIRPWASRLVFEITERAAVPNPARFKENISTLRRHGFRVAVDDLGAGYAGLNSVALLDPDFVKIDRELIMGIDASETKQRLLASMVHFANEEGIRVVAEGIETKQEAETVMSLGCHLLQGYYFGRPALLDHPNKGRKGSS